MVRTLRFRVRQLDDGRFYMRYWWHWWERLHRAYFENEEELAKFVT